MTCVKVELTRQNQKAGVTLFAMNKITQTMQFRQAVFKQIRRHRSSYSLPVEPAVYLPLAQAVRWYTPIAGRPLSPAASSSKPAHTGRNQAHPEHAPPQPEYRDRCVVGQAQAKRLHPIHFRAVSFPAKTWRYGRKTAESQVYSKTL